MNSKRTDRILEELWKPDEQVEDLNLFAVLDAARNDEVFPLVMSSDLDNACLFSGKLPRELAMAAPYIVELRPDTGGTSELVERAWGNSWGIFVSSDKELGELRHHFRHFLKVKDEETKKTMLFRFYDPRVMRVYLPTCNPDELLYVLDPVRRLCLESENPDEMEVFSLEHPVIFGEEVKLVREVVEITGQVRQG
jgi:hypothetical protein